ncbi:unnamed protein product, partial [Allacma fusca]
NQYLTEPKNGRDFKECRENVACSERTRGLDKEQNPRYGWLKITFRVTKLRINREE